MSETIALWTLFSSSFLASTLLPGGSEAVLGYAAMEKAAPTTLLWGTATLGNTLGGLTSWAIGWWLLWRFPDKGLHKPEHRKAQQRIQRYGSPLLLLSWLPVVGDPLCLAAGWSGIRLLPAMLFIAIGKAARYGVLLALLPAG
ncbi:MAG: VTT domain-containing protein [Sedimenticola sp.]